MKSLIFTITAIFLLNIVSANAQKVKNFDRNGKITESLTDYLQIELVTAGDGQPAFFSGILSGIAGSVPALVIDYIQGRLAKKQQSFAATYSSQAVIRIPSEVYDNLKVNGKNYNLRIRRFMVNSLNDKLDPKTDLCSEFLFSFANFGENVIRLSLVSAWVKKAKARVNNDGENLALGLNIKISTGIKYVDQSSGETGAGDSADSSAGNNTGGKKESGAKSGGKDKANGADKTGGNDKTTSTGDNEAIVKIPVIKPDETPIKIDGSVKIISDAYFAGIPKPAGGKPLYLTIAVTVSEANLDHLEPGIVENMIQNNGSDIASLLKSIFSSGSGSGSSGDKKSSN
jgi:hypothetical protein